jgi:hypothetical protein
VRSRQIVFALIAGSVLVAGGVTLAQAQQSPTPGPSTSAPGTSALLDDVARRVGVSRSALDAALRDQALPDVAWGEENGFLTAAQASALRDRINAGARGRNGRFGDRGLFVLGPLELGHGFFEGRWEEPSLLTAAAGYLGRSETELQNDLASGKTLATSRGSAARRWPGWSRRCGTPGRPPWTEP